MSVTRPVYHKALGVVFLDYHCSISNPMIAILKELTAGFPDQDLDFAGVVSDDGTFNEFYWLLRL